MFDPISSRLYMLDKFNVMLVLHLKMLPSHRLLLIVWALWVVTVATRTISSGTYAIMLLGNSTAPKLFRWVFTKCQCHTSIPTIMACVCRTCRSSCPTSSGLTFTKQIQAHGIKFSARTLFDNLFGKMWQVRFQQIPITIGSCTMHLTAFLCGFTETMLQSGKVSHHCLH